jgi:hypothetical protein
VTGVHDAPKRVLVHTDERGPMQVGPDGEGELAVLLRVSGGLVGGVAGARFVVMVASNFDATTPLVVQARVFVTIVLMTVFLPEVLRILARRRRRS